MKSSPWITIVGLVWLVTILSGLWGMLVYVSVPGAAPVAPPHGPASSRMLHSPDDEPLACGKDTAGAGHGGIHGNPWPRYEIATEGKGAGTATGTGVKSHFPHSAPLQRSPLRVPAKIEARARKIRYAPFPGDRRGVESALAQHSWN